MQAYFREPPVPPGPMKYTKRYFTAVAIHPAPRKNIVDLRLLLIYTILCGDYENEEGIA